MSPAVAAMWNAFLATRQVSAQPYDVFHFADSEAVAHELAELVMAGTKRATAGLLWSAEAEGRAIPQPGDLSVVTLWDGTPRCIIETRIVDILPYDAVPASFAAIEGEGDKSLAYWRRVHWEYFGRVCDRLGRPATLQMPVICEQFEVVF